MKSTQPSLALNGLHDFLIFSNRMARAWSVEAGNICSVSVFIVRVGSQISPRRAKKDPNIPSPGRKDQSNALPQGQQRQSNPHRMPCPPPPPLRLYIDRCIRTWFILTRSKRNWPLQWKKKSLLFLPASACRRDRVWFAFIWWHFPDRKVSGKTLRADHTWQNPPRLS